MEDIALRDRHEKGLTGKYDLTNFERNMVRFKVGYDF